MSIQFTITDTRNPKDRFRRSFVQNKITIGRARHCDICLPDLSVSTCHAEVRLQDNDFCLVDNGSLNGTFINGRKLVAHRPKKLKNDDLFAVSHFEIQFQPGATLVAPTGRHLAQTQALQMLGSVLSMTTVPVAPAIEIVSRAGKTSRFELPPAPSRTVIGRAMDADIRLDDPDVSRKHAEIIYEDGKITVNDLGSRAGILINEGRRRSFELTADSVFTVGKTSIGLAHHLDPSLQHIQNAPEEETASFCAGIDTPVTLPSAASAETDNSSNAAAPTEPDSLTDSDTSSGPMPNPAAASAAETLSTTAASTPAADETPLSLPIGPDDPLVANGEPPGTDPPRESQSPSAQKSDLGLIVVGAIVVVSCVLALIRLLT